MAPWVSTPELPFVDDYDVYAEVDQALLRGPSAPVLTRPRVVEIVAQGWSSVEAGGIVREVHALAPQYVIVRFDERADLDPWGDLATPGTELRLHHRVPDGRTSDVDYTRTDARRLRVDLSAISPDAWGERLVREIAPAVSSLGRPVELILPLDHDGLDPLQNALEGLRAVTTVPVIVSLLIRGFAPPDAAAFRLLAAMADAEAGAVQIRGLDYYRLARLHLYYHLPLLRLCVTETREVLPLPLAPVRLGSLRASSLADLWEQSRHDFWTRPDVQAAYRGTYRMADILGGSR